jgi:anhydro-N-acetylmuramic acid kinase
MPKTRRKAQLFIGLMSGTSLDGVDGVLASFASGVATSGVATSGVATSGVDTSGVDTSGVATSGVATSGVDTSGVDTSGAAGSIQTLTTTYLPFPARLRSRLMALQAPAVNELHHEALAANALAQCYSECVARLLKQAQVAPADVTAIGAHGQTIRHRPESGYTRQTNNPALLAELTGIDVVADFRSRDVAAGGQGAPLVPAFHQAVFGNTGETRAVVNIGGIGNISVLEREGTVTGFDTGPGNVLMDAWIAQHRGEAYDADGAWAASGKVLPDLLDALLDEPYLALPPPKSTGRDLFHAIWLTGKLALFPRIAPVDVQATLAAYTAATLANAISAHGSRASTIYVCGGGAYNSHLMSQFRAALTKRGHPASVYTTDALGVSPNHVEALAFAWLARRHVEREPGNLSAVTGAKGMRVLGALYPA